MMLASPPAADTLAAHPELHYAPAPSRRRRTVRRLSFILLTLAILTLLLIWHKPLWSQARLLWWQRACSTYQLSPDTIVAQTIDRKTTGIASPSCWLGYQPPAAPANPNSLFENLAFLHQRTSKSGHTRIVAIRCIPTYLTSASITQGLQPIVVQPIGTFDFTNRPKLHPGPFHGGYPIFAPMQLFAGQPDPADDSHFTIAYTLNNHPGTIDGWLNDDDTVKLQVREGSATLFPTIRR